jgi:CRP-like cAMP-binding protein
MDIEAIRKRFPLFNATKASTLAPLLSAASQQEYAADSAIVVEDAWGSAIYFILSGWVKVRSLSQASERTLAILGQGDFFGEMAVLDQAPRSTDVVALSTVQLFRIAAPQFLQSLLQDSQLQQRLLQLMVRRLRISNLCLQLQRQPAAVRLANTLVLLSEQYGQPLESGMVLFNIPLPDLADVSCLELAQTTAVFEKLLAKGWVKIDQEQQTLLLLNLKQLNNLAGHAWERN